MATQLADGLGLQGGQLALVPYTDSKEGFTLLRPSGFEQVDKAGATLLFEDPAQRSTSIGVVVNPVRISSLPEFGTPDEVAEKLIQAEQRKQSTKEARLIKVGERKARGGVPLYTLEYYLDSTRGMKPTMTAVTIARRKLYILNISYADKSSAPAPPALADSLREVLDSFDLSA